MFLSQVCFMELCVICTNNIYVEWDTRECLEKYKLLLICANLNSETAK